MEGGAALPRCGHGPDDGLAGLAERQRCVTALPSAPWLVNARCAFACRRSTESLLPTPGALTADHEGFSLNAAVACGAQSGTSSSGCAVYMARGPLSNERLSYRWRRLVVHELKRPFRDGTTQCLFEPLDFLARLSCAGSPTAEHIWCGITVCYSGHPALRPSGQPSAAQNRSRRFCRAQRAASRAAGVRTLRPRALRRAVEEPEAALSGAAMTWMQRLRRVYDIDVSVCPNCGGDAQSAGGDNRATGNRLDSRAPGQASSARTTGGGLSTVRSGVVGGALVFNHIDA